MRFFLPFTAIFLLFCTSAFCAPGNSDANALLSIRRELANTQADLEELREENKQLRARLATLEQQNAAFRKERQQQQALFSAMDQKFQELEQVWNAKFKSQIGELRDALSTERADRLKAMGQFSKEISKELEANASVSQQKNSGKSEEYLTIQVEKGDNLSSIAKAAKTTVAELIKINKLKNANIRIGQKLKVPANP